MTKTTSIEQEAASTLRRLETKDPGLKQLLKKAYGYAVFPTVGKAALVVGGSYGKGAVFEKGKFVGYATLGQTTVGVQIGGDTYSEVIVFENKQQFDRLKQGKLSFAADASAILVKAGAAAAKGFGKGARAFVYGAGGMLLEAAIGGQKFSFKPAAEDKGDSGKGQQNRQQQEDEQEQDDEQEGEDQGSEDQSDLMTRAASGMRTAVSQTTDFVKRHPVISSFVGAGVATGVALLVMRQLRSSGGQDEQQQEDEDSDQDNEAEDQYDDQQAEDDDEQDSEGEEEESRFAGGRRSSR